MCEYYVTIVKVRLSSAEESLLTAKASPNTQELKCKIQSKGVCNDLYFLKGHLYTITQVNNVKSGQSFPRFHLKEKDSLTQPPPSFLRETDGGI